MMKAARSATFYDESELMFTSSSSDLKTATFLSASIPNRTLFLLSIRTTVILIGLWPGCLIRIVSSFFRDSTSIRYPFVKVCA